MIGKLKFSETVRHWLALYRPGKHAWQGAGWGIVILLAVFSVFWAVTLMNVPAPNWGELAGMAANLVLAILAGWLVMLLARLLFKNSPRFFVWALAATLLVLYPALNLVFINGGTFLILFFLAASSLACAGVWSLAYGKKGRLTGEQRSTALAGFSMGLIMLAYGVFWLAYPGSSAALTEGSSPSVIPALDLPDPSLPGSYEVQTLTYGSGTDLHRPEFSTQADLVTQPVDGSAFIDGWSGWGGRLRSAYWGFDPSHLPLNGRVWYPAGDGPFPLVLVVHGNHMMEDFSDAGYAYLGELLASRGFIVVSVDENFLNAAPAIDYLGPVPTGLTRSHDARAWLLLEHLRTWRSWSETPGNPFYQKVDMERIALIGHSRGGNATAVAANFNRLPYYPENAHVLFNYHFNIRAVIAIAPTERSTYPAGHPATLQDTDYLVLQGAHDGEVISFDGTNQYARTVSGSGVYHFKSAVYIHGANHSRFNTAWGLTDNNPIYAPLLNTAQIMPPDEQRKIAQVYISAFLEASLRGERGYLPFFGDSRRAVGWLPAATIISRFEDSTTRSLSTFEEDANLNSTTLGGGTISADNLALWKETLVPRTSGDQGSHAVFLHWEDAKAAYSLSLPSNDVPLSPDNLLTFSLADARTPAAGIEPIDLSIELLDASGQAARLPLSTFNILQPQLSVRRFKTGLVFETATAEPVFQSFMFPLSAFQQANPAFDPSRLTTVRFIFNITPEGTVYLDDVGFTE